MVASCFQACWLNHTSRSYACRFRPANDASIHRAHDRTYMRRRLGPLGLENYDSSGISAFGAPSSEPKAEFVLFHLRGKELLGAMTLSIAFLSGDSQPV